MSAAVLTSSHRCSRWAFDLDAPQDSQGPEPQGPRRERPQGQGRQASSGPSGQITFPQRLADAACDVDR
eukprot:14849764-Alexandrium_andersonii.AAC.1